MRARLAIVAGLAATVAALASPAGAGATLVFTRNPFHPAVFAAADTGKRVHRIGAGDAPHVTPNGRSVLFLSAGKEPELTLAPAGGGHPRILMKGWQETFHLAFSPDSSTVAALRGGELGKRKLVAIDLASGRQKVLAGGFFDGFSFSPDGKQIVFSRSGKSFSGTGNLFRVAVGGGQPIALTHDNKSIDPLWGPHGRIVFDRVRNLKSEFGPKADLYLIGPGGGTAKRLTRTRIAPLLFGLSPVAWSGDGSRLVAEFGGQDTSYGVTVNPRTGAERKLVPGDFEQGFVADAISRDGRFVLGTTGGEEPGPNHQVAEIPYGGGKPRVLVGNGYEADWSR